MTETRADQVNRIGLRTLTRAELEHELEKAEQRGAMQALAAEYLSVNEAVQLLGCSRVCLYKWMRQGKLHYVRSVGGRRLIPSKQLAELRASAA
jgi:excisionase family DNA binding protein